jgi:hypothetical protein
MQNKLSLIAAGIDYVTLTTTNSHTKRRMEEYFDGLVASDRSLGFREKKGGAFGFYGTRTRHGLIAQKEERMLMQVSGQAAQHTFKLMREGDNCTRIDIQVTLRVEEGSVSEMLDAACAEARSAPAVRGIRPAVKRIEGDKGTECVYIGKRQSDVFIRIYDKYIESGKEEYKDCIRYEVELKGKTSKALWNKCSKDGGGVGFFLGVLRTCLERRGLKMSGFVWPTESQAIPLKENTSLARTRAWWAKQVAPSVLRDVAEWGFYTAFSILFERCLTEYDKSAILSAWSIVWGN